MPERGRGGLSRATIVEALTALGRELSSRGVRAQVFVVGGAAIALAYSTRRVTKDVDAAFEPKAIVYEAAAKVADELGLPADWLNDGAKAFMPGVDADAQPLPEVEGIEVSTASPRYLLAMKLMATRFGEDDEDIEMLLRMLDVHSPDEALAILESLYPRLDPPPKTRFFLEELLGGSDRPSG